jgi:hypothetical protein
VARRGLIERAHDVGRPDLGKHLGHHAQARVVVDHAHDLDLAPAGDVALPQLVGELRAEAHVGAARSLVRLRGDKTLSLEHAPDRRGRGDLLVFARQVGVDRLRAGVKAVFAQLLSQREDLRHESLGGLARRAPWPPRAGHKARLAFGAIARDQLVDPAAIHPVAGRQLGDRPPLEQMSLHQIPRHPHRRTPSLGVSDVLTQVSPIS